MRFTVSSPLAVFGGNAEADPDGGAEPEAEADADEWDEITKTLLDAYDRGLSVSQVWDIAVEHVPEDFIDFDALAIELVKRDAKQRSTDTDGGADSTRETSANAAADGYVMRTPSMGEQTEQRDTDRARNVSYAGRGISSSPDEKQEEHVLLTPNLADRERKVSYAGRGMEANTSGSGDEFVMLTPSLYRTQKESERR